ncbi:MAG: hypothetical protein ACRC33_23680 [Gemmataceae bacterium]
MSTKPGQEDGSQILLMLAASFGFAAVMYFSGGNRLIDQANAKRSVLRQLRDSGRDATGESVSRNTGRERFDTKRLRFITPSDTYIRYSVAGQTVEVKEGAWGTARGADVKVRYLPSDPEVMYHTSEPDALKAIHGEIRGYTLQLAFVWAVIVAPAALGVFVALASINPDNGTFNLIALILTAVASVALYLYLVW